MIRFLAAALALLPVAAYADEAAADKCAQSLGKDARAIYDKVAPTLAPGADVRATLKATVPGMAKSGEIAMASARDNARAAGGCLLKR